MHSAMIKNLFFIATLISIMQMYAMEKECCIVPRFPREIWKNIAHYMIELHYESDEEFIRRPTIPQPLLIPEKYKSYISSRSHKIALAPSGKVIGLLEHTGAMYSQLWDNRIEIIEACSGKKLQMISYQCAYDPLSIDFNLQGTNIIIHTTSRPDIYPLYEEVKQLSTIQDNHFKMLILQKFFDQENLPMK